MTDGTLDAWARRPTWLNYMLVQFILRHSEIVFEIPSIINLSMVFEFIVVCAVARAQAPHPKNQARDAFIPTLFALSFGIMPDTKSQV
jgi:hypothetical protein